MLSDHRSPSAAENKLLAKNDKVIIYYQERRQTLIDGRRFRVQSTSISVPEFPENPHQNADVKFLDNTEIAYFQLSVPFSLSFSFYNRSVVHRSRY